MHATPTCDRMGSAYLPPRLSYSHLFRALHRFPFLVLFLSFSELPNPNPQTEPCEWKKIIWRFHLRSCSASASASWCVLRISSLSRASEFGASSSAMEFLKEDFLALQIGSSAESLHKSLDSQRELFHSQIDQLQRIVGTQCRLTGVNPLSQEMVRCCCFFFSCLLFGCRETVGNEKINWRAKFR